MRAVRVSAVLTSVGFAMWSASAVAAPSPLAAEFPAATKTGLVFPLAGGALVTSSPTPSLVVAERLDARGRLAGAFATRARAHGLRPALQAGGAVSPIGGVNAGQVDGAGLVAVGPDGARQAGCFGVILAAGVCVEGEAGLNGLTVVARRAAARLWSRPLPGVALGDQATGTAGTAVFAADDAGGVYVGAGAPTPPSIANAFAVVPVEGTVARVAAADGTLAWTRTCPQLRIVAPLPNGVLLQHGTGRLEAVGTDGSPLWSSPASGLQSAAGSGRYVGLTNAAGTRAVVLDAQDGSRLWRAAGRILDVRAGRAAVAAVSASGRNELRIVEARSGRITARWPSATRITSAAITSPTAVLVTVAGAGTPGEGLTYRLTATGARAAALARVEARLRASRAAPAARIVQHRAAGSCTVGSCTLPARRGVIAELRVWQATTATITTPGPRAGSRTVTRVVVPAGVSWLRLPGTPGTVRIAWQGGTRTSLSVARLSR